MPEVANFVDADTCPFARVVDVVQPFLTESQTELPSMMMIPSPIMDGSAPRIMVTVRSSEFSVILDSGAEMSVLPLEQVEKFQPPVQLPATIHEVRTFGPSTATLFGPVPLDISLCGVQIRHPFYFVDAALPPIVGYDLMEAARLVVDVDNHLVWSRRLQASVPFSPNPPVSVPNPTINACVSFLRPESSAPPVEESSPSFSVAEVPLSVSVESTSPMSSVVSRQVSVVVPLLRVGASILNPHASLFRPRATSLPSDAHRPRADSSTQHRYLPVYPLVDSDDTLVKTPHSLAPSFQLLDSRMILQFRLTFKNSLMRQSTMHTCPSRCNRTLPQSCVAIATHLQQIHWIWGFVLCYSTTSTLVMRSLSNSPLADHLLLLVKLKMLS